MCKRLLVDTWQEILRAWRVTPLLLRGIFTEAWGDAASLQILLDGVHLTYRVRVRSRARQGPGF